jgi:tetratricopeptide (TPR) repeat protein
MARQAALTEAGTPADAGVPRKCRLRIGAVGAAILFLARLASASQAAPQPGQETYWDRIMRGQSARLMSQGAEWMQAGAYKQAVDVFAKAVVSSPNEPLTHMMLGVAYYWSGQVDQAMTEYKEALRLDPSDAQAHQLKGIAHAWKGDVDDAWVEFSSAAALDPKRADVQMNLGSVLEARGDLSGALDRFRHSVALEPKHPLYRQQLGTLYARLGRDDEARDSFKQALDIYPSYQDALLELGSLEERAGRSKDALDLFAKAVKNKPRDAVARFLLASADWKSGKRADAKKALQDAFHVSPLDKGGLALSMAYAGKPTSGGSGKPSDDGKQEPPPSDPVDQLKRNLQRLPADKKERVEVNLVYLPEPKLQVRKPQEGTSLKRALEGEPRPIAVKREFVLPAGDLASREAQIENVVAGLKDVLKNRPAGQVHLGMNVKVEEPFGQEAQDAKVAYEPHQEDNELGLWVVGTSWTELVKESLSGLEHDAALIRGAGLLTIGEASDAEAEFLSLTQSQPKEVLPKLGLAAAFVASGREAEAAEVYREVQKLDPKNGVARDALKWLESGPGAKKPDARK